jgi:hypothetical protein
MYLGPFLVIFLKSVPCSSREFRTGATTVESGMELTLGAWDEMPRALMGSRMSSMASSSS